MKRSTKAAFALLLLCELLFDLASCQTGTSMPPSPDPNASSTTSASTPTQAAAAGSSAGLVLSPMSTIVSNTTAVTAGASVVCSNDSIVQKCISSFKSLYAFVPNDTHADAALLGKLSCFNYTGKLNDSCASEIPQNCTVLSQALANNRSSFGVLCTASGDLKQFEWASLTCQNMASPVIRAISDTTAAFCSSGINSSLVCNTTSSGLEVIDKKVLLNAVLRKNTCPGPTTTPIPLLPNPVSPAAMTAIVVLVVIGIICILAGFFFWPKCHVSEDEIRLAEKRKRLKKKKAAKMNSAYAYTEKPMTAAGYASQFGGAKYDVERGNVAVQTPRVPLGPGPPAA